ncbi:MAG: TIM barrel protein [Bacteroidales bacterium]|nr:TIM barrel protein [Bacteroidales bacterium]
MDRRDFLKSTMVGAAGVAIASSPIAALTSCTPKKEACCNTQLKISFQEGTAPRQSLNEKFDYMESLGVVGFEPGGRGLAGRVNEIQQALNGRNIKVSAICAGFGGFILAEDPAVKAEFDSTMREIIAAAGELGSTGVIMVPAFNGQTPCKPHTRETREYLCEQMHELGEFALKHNTTVILEPLNRKEAHYLRQVADAAAICRDSKSAGVKCMGDFWHMSEETSDYAALLAAGPEYLQHVHIASRGNRKMPGENGEVDNYVDGFRALKQMGYDKYVSFECGCNGDKEILVPAAVELLRSQWELA